MPSIKQIDLSNGLEIITTGSLANFSMTTIELETRIAGLAGNIKKKEERINKWLNQQEPFLRRRPLSDFPPEDPIRLGTTVGGEVVDGDEVLIQRFYVAIHILETNPLKIEAMTSDFPIGGDWWL